MNANEREPLLTAALLRKLEQWQIASRHASGGRSRGNRLSRRKGRGMEFADFRPYAVGDDFRSLDWNLFARLERLFVRQALEEADLHVHLLVDVSTSMNFGSPTKLLYAKRMAAALGCIGLLHHDRVTVWPFAAEAAPASFRGRAGIGRLTTFLEGLEPVGPGAFNRAMQSISTRIRERGLVVILSDFLDKQGTTAGLAHFAKRGFGVCAFQILSREEAVPELDGDLRFADAEDHEEKAATVTKALRDRYRLSLDAFRKTLRESCSRLGISFLSTDNQVPVETQVLKLLKAFG